MAKLKMLQHEVNRQLQDYALEIVEVMIAEAREAGEGEDVRQMEEIREGIDRIDPEEDRAFNKLVYAAGEMYGGFEADADAAGFVLGAFVVIMDQES